MLCNVGKIDRISRAIIAIVLIILGITSTNLIMLIVGVSLLFTAISGWCVLYNFFNLNTGCKKTNL